MNFRQTTELKVAVISDIHLGCRRNPAKEIIKNLYEVFPDNNETAALDIIVLAGDVFDTLLSLNEPEIWDIKIWVNWLLRKCKKYNILLRVLRGTPSHDWEQSFMFESMNDTGNIGCDLKYVKELSIEYIEEYGISVLYVPDEWNPSTEKTLDQVKELLAAKGLDQVDFAFMHGQFEYQLPPFVKAQKHSSSEYLRLVKYLIFIGHVHVYSDYERIYAQGSFDRISHGEEKPKGHLRAYVRDVDDYRVEFVENKGAKKFVTVNCRAMTLEETLKEISEQVRDLPKGSHVRISADFRNPIFTNMEVLTRHFSFITWSKDEREQKTIEEEEENLEESPPPMAMTITRDNVAGLLSSRLISRDVRSEILEVCSQILKEEMEGR